MPAPDGAPVRFVLAIPPVSERGELERAAREVVAVHGDIHDSAFDICAAEFADEVSETFGDGDASRRDADDGELGEVGIALDDFVRDPFEGFFDGCRV